MALDLGGFDENFVRVAYRYEAELAYRWRQAGLSIRYISEALIDHLQAQRGGTAVMASTSQQLGLITVLVRFIFACVRSHCCLPCWDVYVICSGR